jgi:Zn-dependent alcohol dehydrogenases
MIATLTKCRGFAAHKPGGSLEPIEFDLAPLQEDEIELEVSHCGICHSDIHLIDNDWGVSQYPIIPGHEAIGKVIAKGSEVHGLKLGDRVGVGWECRCCSHCEFCETGRENLCAHQLATCVGHSGGFAERLRVQARLAFLIPDAIRSQDAGPLMCGGITVFSPLVRYKVAPLSRVAVLGVGGLGHLAIQYAAAFGCEVTAISSSPDKESEAKKLGAHHFLALSDASIWKRCASQFDLILSTTSADCPWMKLIQLLRPEGTLCLLGAKAAQVDVPVASLIQGSKSISGSNIGGVHLMREMLRFSALHDIRPLIEVFSMRDANVAIEKLRKNAVRYRAVLENDLS